MRETRESMNAPFPPLEQRSRVAAQLQTQIATKAGEYLGATQNGRLLVKLPDGSECVVPPPTHLLDFVSVELALSKKNVHELLVNGSIPDCRSADTLHEIPPLHCTVRLTEPAPERGRARYVGESGKSLPALADRVGAVEQSMRMTVIAIATLAAGYICMELWQHAAEQRVERDKQSDVRRDPAFRPAPKPWERR